MEIISARPYDGRMVLCQDSYVTCWLLMFCLEFFNSLLEQIMLVVCKE